MNGVLEWLNEFLILLGSQQDPLVSRRWAQIKYADDFCRLNLQQLSAGKSIPFFQKHRCRKECMFKKFTTLLYYNFKISNAYCKNYILHFPASLLLTKYVLFPK